MISGLASPKEIASPFNVTFILLAQKVVVAIAIVPIVIAAIFLNFIKKLLLNYDFCIL